jgi:CheY-like chemotaxis protein
MPAAGSLRIVLAEDGVLLREGMSELLRRFGHTVVAAVGDAPALAAAVAAHEPDIVVTDVRMPPGFSDEGLRAAVALRAAHPSLAVLVLSQYVEQTYAAELLDAGPGSATTGVGYLLKTGSGTWRSSSTLWSGSLPGPRSSTKRWSASCCAAATRWSGSPHASARCWR